MIGRLIQLVWEFSALAFLGGAVWTIRKARARGKRLFVDEPTRRLGPRPVNQPNVDHRWDAM
jgi:hypothetical protein